MATVIETQNLTKYYGSARGVEDLCLEVNSGEVFGFLGPNGAGKTTTIRLLMDFIRPTRGTAQVLGMDPRRHSVEIKRRVGNLPGEFGLYSNLTGEQFLDFMAGLRGGCDPVYRKGLAERLDVDLSRRVQAYSHGNKQKVSIIQALMNCPELVILDEPTTGLDPLVQQEFYRIVEETKAEGRTVFVSSHILPEVDRLCDRVGMIRDGRLLAVERIADLKDRAVRRMEVSFDRNVPPSDLAVEGVLAQALESGSNCLSFLVQGNLDGLIKRLAQFTVVDMRYQEASLEDIFLTYYKEDADAR